MTLEEAQKKVDEWIKEYGVKYFSELTNLAVLTEEVGELSRIFSRTYGEQSWKEGSKPENIKETMADEMADILWVLICLANQTDINLEEAFSKNIDKKIKRDANRHKHLKND